MINNFHLYYHIFYMMNHIVYTGPHIGDFWPKNGSENRGGRLHRRCRRRQTARRSYKCARPFPRRSGTAAVHFPGRRGIPAASRPCPRRRSYERRQNPPPACNPAGTFPALWHRRWKHRSFARHRRAVSSSCCGPRTKKSVGNPFLHGVPPFWRKKYPADSSWVSVFHYAGMSANTSSWKVTG